MFNVTANVIPQNDECSIIMVAVKGHNLGTALAENVASWAVGMELGLSNEEVEAAWYVLDALEEPSEVWVTFESRHAQ